jgi:hypothetical protein
VVPQDQLAEEPEEGLGEKKGGVVIGCVWVFLVFLVGLGFELRVSHLQSRFSTA